MPKLNVYLSDELADAVKDTGLPVSAVCQRVLEQSVKRVNAIRAIVLTDVDDDSMAGMTQFTERAKDVLRRAIAGAGERGAAEVGTRDLLLGMLDEGANLALQVLRSIDVDPVVVRREVTRLEQAGEGGPARRIGATAANALELTVIEAISLGHNYVGCEHLLLGLLAEPDGAGGEVLRGLGVDLRGARQAVGAALAGYQHLMAKQSGMAQIATFVTDAVGKALKPVYERLDRLEARG